MTKLKTWEENVKENLKENVLLNDYYGLADSGDNADRKLYKYKDKLSISCKYIYIHLLLVCVMCV